jgi:hypothetical protein
MSLAIGVVASRTSRLQHDVSTISGGLTAIQEPNRIFDRERTEVHVPLRGCEIPVTGELLDRPRLGATHREV